MAALSVWPAASRQCPEGRLVTSERFLWTLSGLWDIEDRKPHLSCLKRSVSSRKGELPLQALKLKINHSVFLAWKADASLAPVRLHLGHGLNQPNPPGWRSDGSPCWGHFHGPPGAPGPGDGAASGWAQLLGAQGLSWGLSFQMCQGRLCRRHLCARRVSLEYLKHVGVGTLPAWRSRPTSVTRPLHAGPRALRLGTGMDLSQQRPWSAHLLKNARPALRFLLGGVSSRACNGL